MHTLIRLSLCLLCCACMISCAATEELMIGGGNSLSLNNGQKLSGNPSVIAAAAGNKIYRYRQFYLGGDHMVKTSSGSEYNHALTSSLQHFLQAAGIAYGAWTNMAIRQADNMLSQYKEGQITEREFQAGLRQIESEQIAAGVTESTTLNPNLQPPLP